MSEKQTNERTAISDKCEECGTTINVQDGSSLASSECSALRDSAIELWDMATTAAVRSMNGEWSDKRFELQTVLFTEKLREIISQNESEPPTEDDR